jgi:glycosyltransferase involved in cell wall biosynthesis
VSEHVLPLSWSPDDFHLTRGYGATVDCLRAMDRHCRQCANEINRGVFDLLLANSSALVAVAPIARHVRIPAVIYLQEPCRKLYEALPELPWVALSRPPGWWGSPAYVRRRVGDFLRVAGLRVQAREELRNARAFVSILVNSYYSRESVLRAYGLDAKVCYLGVDTKLFVDQGKPRENLAVGTGAFAPHKNIDFIIRALAHVRRPRPRLVWIGNVAVGSYLKQLTELAAAKDVDFEPKLRIQDSELVDLLNRAKIMLYSPRLEPFGFAALEGNGCGLPVVAVAEGGVRETIIHGVNGLLAEHDPQAMAAAIQLLLDDPVLARRLGENGCKLVAERWTVQHSVDRLENRLLQTLQIATGDKGNLHHEYARARE